MTGQNKENDIKVMGFRDSSRQTLAVVVITLNEEANLERCLQGVTWADEIVILDSGSTDRTLDIARKYTDRVYQRTWTGYSQQRNAAHDLADMDWILSLDADEVVTDQLAREIEDILAGKMERSADISGYFLPYKVFYRDKWLKHGGFFPEKHLRLFRRGQGRYGDRDVHEALKVDGPTGQLTGYIEHYTYGSVSDFIDRLERYSSLSAREYFRQGRRTGPIRLGLHGLFNFFKMYFFQLGFLDGYEGFLLAVLYSFYTFVKYAKLKELGDGAPGGKEPVASRFGDREPGETETRENEVGEKD